jgi:thiol-disulfide isomerase/thioredoxin
MAFFGTWCSTCREELPALFATLDAAANPVLTVRLIAVAEDLSEPSDLLAAYGVGDIPTLIGSDNGIEIGRIVDAPRTKLETELAEMLGVAPGR